MIKYVYLSLSRYIIGNLNDFDPAVDAVPYEQLPAVDKYILGELSIVSKQVEDAYDSYRFYQANQAIVQFTNVDLSSFYLDIAKDRLYISSKNDLRRRSCQTVLYYLLEQLTVMMAPIVPHLAEDVWQNIPYKKSELSVFNKGWIQPKDHFKEFDTATWNAIR